MRLPDFIKRALSFFDSTESRLAKLEESKPKASQDSESNAHCGGCSGSGKCDVCEGSGQAQGADCSECEGSGKCDQCEGKGTAASQLTKVQEANRTLQALVSNLQKQAADSNTLLEAAKKEVTTLTEALAVEKKRANETIAAQGLPLNRVPATSPNPDVAGQSQQNAWEKYQALLGENPRAAGEFWSKNADQILQNRIKPA